MNGLNLQVKSVDSTSALSSGIQAVNSELWNFRAHYDYMRTREQKVNPYPSNLQTVCNFPRPKKKAGCWLPCEIEEVEENEEDDYHEEDEDGKFYNAWYSRELHEAAAETMADWECAAAKSEHFAEELPATSFSVIDKWGTFDQHLSGAFRQEIGVPAEFFPTVWMQPAVYEITPIATPMKAGQFVPITWAHNGKPVTRNAHFVGLPPNFNAHMHDYCERTGAMDLFREALHDKPNKPGAVRYVELEEGEWYVQRPHWNSNMHWIIPSNEVARQSYLRALGVGGFDDVLDSVGTSFGLSKLTCFHNTFLGISQSDDSIMHADFYETQRRSFDFLLPIIMANTTEPELNLQSIGGNVVVGIKYRYGVAVSLGDWTFHKSAAADYTDSGEIHVVSSIYCSEITEDNRESLLQMYNEEHPAPFHHQFDLPVKEWQWDLQGQKLPTKRRKGSPVPAPPKKVKSPGKPIAKRSSKPTKN